MWWNVEARLRAEGCGDVSILSCFEFSPESLRLRTEVWLLPALGGRGSAPLGGAVGGGSAVLSPRTREKEPEPDGFDNRFDNPSSATVERDVAAVARSDNDELCHVLLE